MSRQPYEWWQSALTVTPLPVHSDPECGYFRVRDRRGLNKDLAPIKRPWVAAAIWQDEAGEFAAELAGEPCTVESLWPYCAKNPIPYETYRAWHETGQWPQEKAA